jgi:hypothetical protein
MCIFEAVRITEHQRQLERLAWAGGLFDGEGSTMARGETSRPGYRRLLVAVPQRGGSTAPDVLVRFMAAMNGMGKIAAPADGIYMWRVSDDTQARATIRLLRPWIGVVKRKQASRAMDVVDRQYASQRVRGRPGRRRPHVATALVDPAALGRESRLRVERAWAAGFLDGEGCFGLARAKSRVGGQPWYRIRASSTQHGEIGIPAAVLRRLHRTVGVGHIECHGGPDDFKWVAEGIPAVEHVLKVVGPWLGAVKREQARDAMTRFTRQARLKGGSTLCKRGHAYDRVTLRRNGTLHRRCNACARLLGRRQRAALGIAPRQFGDVARRYTE